MFRVSCIVAFASAMLVACGGDVVPTPPYEEPSPAPGPLDGLWVGKSMTFMPGAPDDVRPATVVIKGQSNGTHVFGLCPRGEVDAVVAPGETTWGEVRCSSPWTEADDKVLVFASGRLWMAGQELVIEMTGEMQAPGAVNRQAVTRFEGRRE